MSCRRPEKSTSLFMQIEINETIMVSWRRLGHIIDLTSDSILLVLEGWNSIC